MGYGTGGLVRLPAPRAGAVEGTDLSQRMLAVARAAMSAAIYPDVTFICGDAFDGRPPAGAYDAIVSAATLHHMDPRTCLAQV